MSLNSGECANGHCFMHLANPQSFACASCSQIVSTGKYFYGCADCDHDICARCHQEPELRSSKGPVAAAAVNVVEKERVRLKSSISSTPMGAKKSSGMSFLGVAGPVAPHPPERLSLETFTTFRIPDADTFLEDGDECADGEHNFARYAACNPLCCNECNQLLRPGTYVHGCEDCDIDLCEACYASEAQCGIGRQASLPKKAAMAPLVAQFTLQPVLASVPESNSLDLPFDLAKLVTSSDDDCMRSTRSLESSASTATPTEFDEFMSSPRSLESSASIATPSGSEAPWPHSPVSSPRAKECITCDRPYKGFGAICAQCRKSGPVVRQCKECQNYFCGFGIKCKDCKPAATYHTFANMPGFHFCTPVACA